MSSSGTIVVRPLVASLQHDVDIFGKMDPYCLVTLGTQQWKSLICKSGGKTPTWNDEVTFMVQPGIDIMRIALYDDKLIGSDKLIGEGVIPVDKLFNFSGPFEEKIPLTFKAKPCGFIQLRFLVNKGDQLLGEQQNLQQTNLQQTNFQQQNLQQGTYAQEQQIIGTGVMGTTGLTGQQNMTTTAPATQEYVEKLPQQTIPVAGAQTFTNQSVQYGPKIAEVKRDKSPSSSPDKKQKNQQQQFVVASTSQVQQQPMTSQIPGMQAYVTMPQCCLNAVQQHHPGFVPGTTGYTGDIPHHQHAL